MVEKLIGTPTNKNSKGLVIIQIQYTTPKIVAKIVSAGLTTTMRRCDLRLNMLEVVDNIAETRKTYCWAQYLVDLVKNICIKCQQEGTTIIFVSLIIWTAMYYIRPIGDPQFLEPTRFHMWNFKPFSIVENSQEIEVAKVLLNNWFQILKIKTSRWRVPQII